MLSGGGAHGAYEWGALETFVPYWTENNFRIEVVTGVSAGAVNAALLSYALNSGKDVAEVMGSFWKDLGRKGDAYLKPMIDFYTAAAYFNVFKDDADRFPNIPSSLAKSLEMFGKSSLPLDELKSMLDRHIPKGGWTKIQAGQAPAVVFGAVKIDNRTGERTWTEFSGENLTSDTAVLSSALRTFAPRFYNGSRYEDGGYDKNGFILKDRKTDMIFAIGLKPLHDVHAVEDRRGIKTGQFHHDLARHFHDARRTSHIDLLCLDHPRWWNETSAMNNTSRNIDMLYRSGQEDARRTILERGHHFGLQSSYSPPAALSELILMKSGLPAPMAA